MPDVVELLGGAGGGPILDLSAEANHRIANNLSVLAGVVRMRAASVLDQRTSLSGDEVRLLFEELSSRIDAIARLHRQLAGGRRETGIDLGDYVCDVAQALVSSLCCVGQAKLRPVAEPGCVVPSQTALAVGLILVEVITNAIKYAHPTGVAGQITVGCRTVPNGMIIVEVSDDGVGLPEGFDPMTSGHLGMRMMRTLANRIGGAVAFENTGLGLTFMLRIPINAALSAPV